MNNYAHVCFDASLMTNGIVGIGIYDITHNTKIALTYKIKDCEDTLKGETMALICAMDYAYSKNFTKVHFFTDNQQLSNVEIEPNIIKKFPFESYQLSWIPRKLNKEADKMSKAGRNPNSGHWNEASNHINSKKSNTLFNKYTHTQKLVFMKKIAQNKNELVYLKMLEIGKKDHYHFDYKQIKIFIKLSIIIFNKSELSIYVQKRLRKMKLQKLSEDKFKKELKLRIMTIY